ncbi:hypothetical protein BUALT_Bualt09G0008500 [Buddleja alternifolia]|uniref:Major facilitator superfamily (MFS) profile domain-containing protein n=1 Tax=Buddleja alternifolia TaxID=168488 RepID=A0AAV6X027_9LAMI|nr:hypothetical protein BUALT_Bualt09G0008500 [Buddleja alternifolia]
MVASPSAATCGMLDPPGESATDGAGGAAGFKAAMPANTSAIWLLISATSSDKTLTRNAQAHSLDEILFGRFLVGLGIGVNAVLVPIYISEVAPTKFRGSLGTFTQIGTCLGIIASLFLGILSENDSHWWRMMLYIASMPGFVLAFGMEFAVDSPRWLCKAGKFDDAKEVINNLWGPTEVDKAIEEFQSVIRNDGADLHSSWLELLEEPHSRGGTKVYFHFLFD